MDVDGPLWLWAGVNALQFRFQDIVDNLWALFDSVKLSTVNLVEVLNVWHATN